MNTPQWVFLAILAATLWQFVSGRFRIDAVAMLTLLALTITGILTPAEAFAGFSSEPAIIVASVFVISAGLSATGVTERIGEAIGRSAGSSEWRAVLVIMPAVAAMAAFSHHLMVTAMMLPILMRLARDRKLSASRLLMPMSLAASLGTTLTLFSAPAFLLANDLLERRAPDSGLGVLSITPIGLALVVVAILYMSLARWILPKHLSGGDDTDYLRLDSYYTELIVEPDSLWRGRTLAEFQSRFDQRLQLVEWMRGGVRQLADSEGAALRAGDVLMVRASPEEIASIQDEPGLALHALVKYSGREAAAKATDAVSASTMKSKAAGTSPTGSSGEGPAELDVADVADPGGASGGNQLVQVVVAPHSQFAGQTIGSVDFLQTLGVVVIGLWRRQGWIRDEISAVELREGDLLVLWGDPARFTELAQHPGFLMMVPFAPQGLRRTRRAAALSIAAGVVFAAATGLLPAQVAFLAGAVGMVLAGCCSISRAYREIDVRIYVMIAGVIPLGAAMEKTGTAALLSRQLEVLMAGWEPVWVLLALFWASALVTQVLSDAATVVLLGPIALALASSLGLAPQPFVVCSALGAVAAFLTPLGHHGNLLILNPGRYSFGDFLRIGVPLTLLIGGVSAALAHMLWLGPIPALFGP